MRFAFLCVALVCGATVDVLAQAGWVQTLDGRVVAGEVRLTNGAIVVSSNTGISVVVGLKDLGAASFNSPLAGTRAAWPGRGQGLLGFYFLHTNLQGNCVIRLDETVDFDWGLGEPAFGVPEDRFGVVWAGELEAPATGNFIFSMALDDGGRLYLEDRLIVDSWAGSGAGEVFGKPLLLEQGKRYPLKLIFFDYSRNASAHLFWSGPGVPKGIVPTQQLFPGSAFPQHTSVLATNRGLLATYYKNAEFGGDSFTRVDPVVDFTWLDHDPLPGFSRTNFSVRWSGQIQVDHTEEYSFYTLSTDGLRLWVDNKLLIRRPEQNWLAESRESCLLAAGERYDIQLEARVAYGDAVARLMWSSASTPKAVVPATHLFPSKSPPVAAAAGGMGAKTPPGVVLRSGAFVAGRVEQATRTSLRLSGWSRGNPIATLNVAQILCQPLAPVMQARLRPGRPGLLLAKGDFVDAEFRALENDRVVVSSVLFGSRSYDANKEVLVVVLGDAGTVSPLYEVEFRDRALLRVSSLVIEGDMLLIRDATLGTLLIPGQEVAAIRRRQPGGG